MKYELTSIGLWSFIKVAFVVNLVAGAIGGLFALPFWLIIMATLSVATYADPGLYYNDDGSLGTMLFVVPIFISFGAAVVGTFFQSLVILAYNLIASLLGGLELTLNPISGTGRVNDSFSTPAMVQPSRPIVPPPPPPRPAEIPPTPEKPPAPDQDLER